MNSVELLTRQTADAYQWTNKLVTSIPHDHWEEMPQVIDSTISWQVGHLIMSFYYHSIMTIVGHRMDVVSKVPLQQYNELFTAAAPEKAIGKANPITLQQQLILVEEKSLEVIQSLSLADLDSPLEPTPVPHPIAKTKFEALDWNIKHTMWHCGQIGLLKRVIHRRFDFGLQKQN